MKISVVSGGFDPIHSGHISYLKSAKEISDYLNFGNNLKIEKIKFSSINDLEISFTKRFKIENYNIQSSLNIENIVLKNFLNLKYFFPEMKETISFFTYLAKYCKKVVKNCQNFVKNDVFRRFGVSVG